MKVLKIEETVGGDGNPLWMVTLAKQDGTPAKVLLPEHTKPEYSEGDDVRVKLNKEVEPWRYERLPGATPRKSAEKTYKAAPAKSDDIMLMKAWAIADEQTRHHLVPCGKVDTGQLSQIASEIFAYMVMMRPKHDK